MSGAALGLTLAAAVVHAAWNVVLGGARDPLSASGVLLPAAILCGAPLAAATWHVDSAVVPYVAASAAFELAYILLLSAAYARADVSVVYPVARGSAPVIVLAAGRSLALLPAAGVCLIAAGVVCVTGRRGPRRGAELGLALAVGGCIACYTLIDRSGIHHASAPAYFELALLPPAVVCAALAAARGRLRSELRPSALFAGAGMFAAYTLVLAALRIAPAAAVAAVRETGVVFAALIARRALHERVGPLRIAGAASVALGVALIALG